jgi:hypothetical protein
VTVSDVQIHRGQDAQRDHDLRSRLLDDLDDDSDKDFCALLRDVFQGWNQTVEMVVSSYSRKGCAESDGSWNLTLKATNFKDSPRFLSMVLRKCLVRGLLVETGNGKVTSAV